MTAVFFSYSHADEALRDRLERHLSMLKRQGIVDVWHDRRLVPGEAVDAGIAAELERADLILLLVSPDFLASDYCYEREMRRALDLANNLNALGQQIISYRGQAQPNFQRLAPQHQHVDAVVGQQVVWVGWLYWTERRTD